MVNNMVVTSTSDNGEPRVVVTNLTGTVDMTPEEARLLARHLIDASHYIEHRTRSNG